MAKQSMRHFGGATMKAAPVGGGSAKSPKGSGVPAAKSGGARHFGGPTMKAAPTGKGPAKSPSGHKIKAVGGAKSAIKFKKTAVAKSPALQYPSHPTSV